MNPLRFSVLKEMHRSPLHALHTLQDNKEPTLSMRIGSGAHAMLLGGQRIAEYAGTRRGEAWHEFKEANADALILNEKEHDQAKRINDAVRAHKLASQVLFCDGTIYEQTIHWEWRGRAMRCTPDARSWRHLVDLKTTRDADPDKFTRDATRMGYHAQLALYSLAMEHAQGNRPRDVYIVAVESKAPFAVTVCELTRRALEHGEKLCREWMDSWLECEAANRWPGYSETLVPFDVLDGLMDELIFDDEAQETNERQ